MQILEAYHACPARGTCSQQLGSGARHPVSKRFRRELGQHRFGFRIDGKPPQSEQIRLEVDCAFTSDSLKVFRVGGGRLLAVRPVRHADQSVEQLMHDTVAHLAAVFVRVRLEPADIANQSIAKFRHEPTLANAGFGGDADDAASRSAIGGGTFQQQIQFSAASGER